MSLYEQYEEEKKKKGTEISKSTVGSSLFDEYTSSRKAANSPKPSQEAAQKIKDTTKQPGFFDKVKSGLTNVVDTITGKKKEERVSLTKQLEIEKNKNTTTTRVTPLVDPGLSIYNLAAGKEPPPSATRTDVKADYKWGSFTPTLPADETAKSLYTGAGDVVLGTGKILKWQGVDGMGDRLIKKGGEMQVFMPDTTEFEGGLEWKDAYNPRLYTTLIARGSSFTIAMLPLAFMGATTGTGIATALGLGRLGTIILAAIGGSALRTPFEAATEAGTTYDEAYQDAIASGKTPQEARQIGNKAANKTFGGNTLLLGLTNTLQFIPFIKTVGKTAKAAKTASRASKIVKGTGVAAGEFVSEGGEEVGQKQISLWSQDKPFDLTSKETELEFVLGGMQGLVFTAGGAIINKTTGTDVTAEITQIGLKQAEQATNEIVDRIIEEVPGVKEEITKLTNSGVERNEAISQVLDETAEKNKTQMEEISREVLSEKVVQEQQYSKPIPASVQISEEEKKPVKNLEPAREVKIEGMDNVTKYTSAQDFAKAEYSANENDQIGTMDPDKIIPRDPVDEDGVIGYIDKIEKGDPIEPVEIFKDESGEISTTDGSHRSTAFGRMGIPTPVIYRGEGDIEGLQTIKDVYNQANATNKATEPVTKEPLLDTKGFADATGLKGNELQTAWKDFQNYKSDTLTPSEHFESWNKQYKPTLPQPAEDIKELITEEPKSTKKKVEEVKTEVKPKEPTTAEDAQSPAKAQPGVFPKEMTIPSNIAFSRLLEDKKILKTPGAWGSRHWQVKGEIDPKATKLKGTEIVDVNIAMESLTENKTMLPVTKFEKGSIKIFTKLIVLTAEDLKIAVQEKFVDVIRYYHPNSTVRISSDRGPVGFYSGDELVGLTMPVFLEPDDIKNITIADSYLPGETLATLLKEDKSAIVKSDETTTIQPTGLSDTGAVRQPESRRLSPETDERSLHDETTGDGESGTGPIGSGSPVGKVGRVTANSDAETILNYHNFSTNADDYTSQEKDKLRQYSGAGGKEVAGATGKGLLSEYYTPKEVVDKVWQIVGEHAPNASLALEPSIGIGSLLEGRPGNIIFDAYEYQRVSGTIARILNQDVGVFIGNGQEFGNIGNFETHQAKADRDLVVGNPPFGERASFLKGKGEEPKIGRWEEYFIKKGLDSLKDNGTLVYIVNSSFLNKENSNGKEKIAKQGELVQAFRLPEGIFADTTIGTDIVVFRKKTTLSSSEQKKRVVNMTSGNYFESNPDNILGTVETRKNRFGREETYVKGTIADLNKLNATVEEVETVASEKPAKVKKPAKTSYAAKTIKRVKRKTKKDKLPAVIKPDKKKVETIPNQTILGSVASPNLVERELLKTTEVDGSVPYLAEAKKFLNYYKGKYYHNVNYFSGDIYQKLIELESDKSTIVKELGQAQYDKQLKGLEAVKPKPVTLPDITFDPLDRYVTQVEIAPAEGRNEAVKLIHEFVRFVTDSSIPLTYGVSKYDVRNYVMGHRAASGTKQIMGKIKADSGRLFNYYIRNVLAGDIQRSITAQFNREKNSYVNPDYSKLPVEIADMAKYFRGKTFKLSPNQANGVSFLTNKGVGLVAYGVGVGKTHTILTATVVAKQKGWTKRPVFIVPKSTVTNTWIGTIKSMFPNETIVNLGGLTKPDVARLEKERGKDTTKWINDGEIAVLTHEGLLRLALKPEEMVSAIGDLTDALMTEIPTERGRESERDRLVEIIGRAQAQAGTIRISDLGIDHISVDEVHNFRKVFQGAKAEALNPDGTPDTTRVRRFSNVIGGKPSHMAQQLFLISQHILKNNNNRGVYLASATPFENHATEVYNILSFMARDRLKKIGIYNINDFFALYSNFETEIEKNVYGSFKPKEKMKSFRNLQQLQKLLREFVDYQVDETLIRPDRRVLTPTLQMSPLQEENLASIQEMLAGTEGRKPEDGAVLKATTYSIANSISPYFIKEYHPEIVSPETLVDNSPKLKYSMELLRQIKNDPKTFKYGNFLYIGANGVDYHNHLADYAVKHLGYKAKEVAVINGTTSSDEREAIKDGFRAGEIKLLIGGDPTKEGIDLQDNGYTTINVSLGWNPTEMAQVEGRVWRQGNKRLIAPIIYPLVENSGDIFIYNKYEEKGGRINDMFSYAGQVFDVGEVDPSEKKLALMTNPEDKASIAIELDQAELQMKDMMLSTDIANLNRMAEKISTLETDIAYSEERIKTGKTTYDSPLEKADISKYRKELNKAKKDLLNIREKLDKNNIKDIPTEVAKIEKVKEDVNIEIGRIRESYQDRLVKYQQEARDMIASRKSVQDHVNDFVESTKDLRELSKDEIATKKEKLMRELDQKKIASNDLSRYKVPSGNADVGGYADIEPSGDVVQRIRGIQFPELVAMVKEITGSVPKLKAMRRSLGKMYEQGEGKIGLNPKIFDDAVAATKTLAHEIGHLADFIPEGITTRGNMVGHIASLNKFMKGRYGNLINRELRNELKNLSQLWKPFDETVSKSFTSYRYSSKELYADAVSVLLNDPALLKEHAPKFYEGFFEYIHSKPKLEEVYFDTLDLLNQGDEYVNNKRLEGIYEGFRAARKKRTEIENEKKPKRPWWERFMRNHVTKFDPIYRKLGKVNIGVVESSKQKTREALEILQMRRNDQVIFLDRITTQITSALEAIGMNEDDLGVVLKLEREALGDRIDLANPGGLIGNIPEIVLGHYYKKRNLSEEQIKVFEQIKTKFHELMFEETQRAVNNGNFNKEIFKEKIEPNKNTYATFSVVDYIHKNYISAGIKKQVGTLSAIENPFTSSILKTVALIEWNNVQEAKQVIVGELQQYFPNDVKSAKATRTNKGTVIRFAREDNKQVLEMMDDGKRVGFNVDPYIKSMFDSKTMTADELHQLVGISRWFNKMFKPLVTTYNLSWGFYANIVRDQKRTYIMLGSALNKFAPGKKRLSIAELLVSFVKSIPQGAKFAAGKKTELIREMYKNKAITTQWSQYDPNANRDTTIDFLLRQHKIIGKKEETVGLRKAWNKSFGRLLDAIKFAGGAFEATSKISGYQIAKKRIKDGKRLGFITRNYVGTPNYMEGGQWKQVDNDIFVFSNVMIQATRTSVELAVDPKTASGYWMRTFIVGVLPKLLMVAGLSGLFGEWVRKNYQSQTEYDKTNYITVPVGFDENGKAIYMRIPQDETERFISAIVWKATSGIVQKQLLKPGNVLAIGAGYIPSVTPLWEFLGGWLGYLQGRNPYDSYRGRLAIDETSWKAGGLIRLNKMVQYSLNTVGLGRFVTYDDSSKSSLEVKVNRIPIINRMLKVSNYGIQEQYNSDTGQEAAKKSIEKRELISKYVKLGKGLEGEDLRNLRLEMIKEYFGAEPTEDQMSESRRLDSKFLIDRERGSSPYVDRLINSYSNAEKLDYLLQFQKDMREDDFIEMTNAVWKHKIISDAVMESLKEELKKLEPESTP